MALKTEIIDANCELRLTVTCNSAQKPAEIEKTIDQLREALIIVRENFLDSDYYCFGIVLDATNPSLFTRVSQILKRKFSKPASRAMIDVTKKPIVFTTEKALLKDLFENEWTPLNDPIELDPWRSVNYPFWIAALRIEELRPKIKALLDHMAKTIAIANKTRRSYSSLWESDETQFGEPLASLLALHDEEFVPNYTEMCRHWDPGHEVTQTTIVEAIVKKYGLTPHTEELLYQRIVEDGCENQLDALFPFLQSNNGTFTKSPLFHRIIQGIHAKDYKAREKGYQEYLVREATEAQKEEKKRKYVQRPNNGKRMVFAYSDFEEITDDAARIIGELDIAAGIDFTAYPNGVWG